MASLGSIKNHIFFGVYTRRYMGSEKRATAYHEAGHAVVAWACGIAIGEITIDSGQDFWGREVAGRSQFRQVDSNSLLDEAMSWLSGGIAQDLFSPGFPRGDEDDIERARDALSIYLGEGHSIDDVDKELTRVRMAAADMLTRKSRSVHALATELLLHGSLNAERVSSILAKACGQN